MRLAIGAALLAVLTLLPPLAALQKRPKIVVMNHPSVELAELKAAAPAAEWIPVSGPQAALKYIADADALMGHLTVDLVRAGKRLRWIQVYGAGVDEYRFPELVESDIVLTNCKIIQGPEIADHAFALLLDLTRRLHAIIPRRHEEQPLRHLFTGDNTPIELNGKRALIIGLGGIGMQIAQRAAAFGMEVYALDPKDIPYVHFVEKVDPPDRLHDRLPTADVVFMSVPLTRETQGMIGGPEFAMMKRGAYFVCVGRGKTYDAHALAQALQAKRLAGAGVDVTDPEPLPQGHPLWKCENVIITPHVATRSYNVLKRRAQLLKENARRFLEGAPLLHVVDKQKGY